MGQEKGKNGNSNGLPGVDHVEEVKLSVDRNGRFLPGIVGRAALPNHQVLRVMALVVFGVVCVGGGGCGGDIVVGGSGGAGSGGGSGGVAGLGYYDIILY